VLVFFIMFIALYGVLNLYTLRWLKPAFAWKRIRWRGVWRCCVLDRKSVV